MQRTINEIYQQLLNEKRQMPTLNEKLSKDDNVINSEQDLLDNLTSEHKVSIWHLIFYVVAVAIWIHEGLWYHFKDTVQELIDVQFVGTAKWLREQVLKFQVGYDVTVEPPVYHPFYDTIDENAQIIQSCTVRENNGFVYVKVRRKDTDILDQQEYASLEAYLDKIKVAGQVFFVENYKADLIKLYYTIYYDPIYELNDVKNWVYDAINNYLANIEFDARIDITALTDEIQKKDGVKAVQYDEGYGRAYVDTNWIPIENYYVSLAGWCEIDSNFPLTDTITFEPYK